VPDRTGAADFGACAAWVNHLFLWGGGLCSGVYLSCGRYLDEFGKLAKTNNSIIIPSNLSDIAGMIKGVSSVIKQQTDVNQTKQEAA
jgi:hypothetical protein